jgi:hypothetical protein
MLKGVHCLNGEALEWPTRASVRLGILGAGLPEPDPVSVPGDGFADTATA